MYDPQLGRFHSVDAYAEKYINYTPYQYGANNPVLYIDINGDSLQVTTDAILAIYHALDQNSNVHFDVKNGMIDPESFKEQAENSDDIVLKDLYEIASNENIVEMSVTTNFNYKDNNGNIVNSDKSPFKFNVPYDFNTNEIPEAEQMLINAGEPTGKTIQGNLGQVLIPGGNSITGANSTNGNVQIIINANGNLNHRAVGTAHEFGHVVLFLRGLPYTHLDKSANKEIYKRENVVVKRLGYDF